MECALCKGTEFKHMYTISNANTISGIKEFEVIRCIECHLCQMRPFPDAQQLKEIYVEKKVFSQIPPNPNKGKFLFDWLEPLYYKYGSDDRFVVKNCLKLTGNITTKHILDIGSSTGNLLKMFREYDPDSIINGIDIDSNAKTNAPTDIRDSIRIEDFIGAQFTQSFDIICMKTVVEHLPNMRLYVKKAVSLLNHGGILFISTPDIDSKAAQLKKRDWEMINDPKKKLGHIIWFNKKSAKILSELMDTELIFCRNRGPIFYHLPSFFRKLVTNIFGTDPISGRPIRNYTFRIICAIIFDGLLSEKLSYGDVLYLFLRKP